MCSHKLRQQSFVDGLQCSVLCCWCVLFPFGLSFPFVLILYNRLEFQAWKTGPDFIINLKTLEKKKEKKKKKKEKKKKEKEKEKGKKRKKKKKRLLLLYVEAKLG